MQAGKAGEQSPSNMAVLLMDVVWMHNGLVVALSKAFGTCQASKMVSSPMQWEPNSVINKSII